MRHVTHLLSLALAVALVALGNIVVIESASAQPRPSASGSGARPPARPAQAQPGRATTPPRTQQVRRQGTAPPQAAANRTRLGQRSAQARSATGDTRRYGVNLGNTGSPLNWSTWNRATRPATAAPAPQRARQSRSGKTVAFRLHRSTAASATAARPATGASVYRSAPTQRRAVANQARTTQRASSGRAVIGDGRRNAVNLGTASPVSTWSGWNRAVNVLAPAATPARTRQDGGGRQVTFREARASVELTRLRRDAAGNLITP
jgi:hypothetical protein